MTDEEKKEFWEFFFYSTKYQDSYGAMHMPDGESYMLDNEFYRDKRIQHEVVNIDDWYIKKWTTYWEPVYHGGTLGDVFTAKIFDGESMLDLYERGYDWFAGTVEKGT